MGVRLGFGMPAVDYNDPADVADKFIHHDPKHDIAVDVMRIQALAQAL
mgnify:FL=1